MAPKQLQISELGAPVEHAHGWRAQAKINGINVRGPQRDTEKKAWADVALARQSTSREAYARCLEEIRATVNKEKPVKEDAQVHQDAHNAQADASDARSISVQQAMSEPVADNARHGSKPRQQPRAARLQEFTYFVRGVAAELRARASSEQGEAAEGGAAEKFRKVLRPTNSNEERKWYDFLHPDRTTFSEAEKRQLQELYDWLISSSAGASEPSAQLPGPEIKKEYDVKEEDVQVHNPKCVNQKAFDGWVSHPWLSCLC